MPTARRQIGQPRGDECRLPAAGRGADQRHLRRGGAREAIVQPLPMDVALTRSGRRNFGASSVEVAGSAVASPSVMGRQYRHTSAESQTAMWYRAG